MTPIEAEDAIKNHFVTKWVNGINSGLPEYGIGPLVFQAYNGVVYLPQIRWQDQQLTSVPPKDRTWCRFTMQNVIKNQASLAGGRVNGVGTKYTTEGIIIVQLFFDKLKFDSERNKNLTFIVENAFTQANVDGVWYRNAVSQDLEPEDTFFRANVNVDYSFDTIKL